MSAQHAPGPQWCPWSGRDVDEYTAGDSPIWPMFDCGGCKRLIVPVERRGNLHDAKGFRRSSHYLARHQMRKEKE